MLDPRNIDLNLLVVFNEIFQEQEISSVAKRLNLSQPAASNALARLRKTIDDPLFVRTKEGMQPTPFAQQLAEPIRLALNGLTQAMNVQENFDAANSSRHFTIALTDVAELYFMPILIEQLAKLAPHIRISTQRTDTINLMNELGSGQVDLAIGAFDTISEALYTCNGAAKTGGECCGSVQTALPTYSTSFAGFTNQYFLAPALQPRPGKSVAA